MKRLLVCSLGHGGICHYTYCLADALHLLGDNVTVLTQDYPAYELSGIAHTHRLKPVLKVGIGRLSRLYTPFANLQCLTLEARDVPLVHFQWPLGPRTDHMTWRALKRQGKRIVYTAHNVVPHEVGNKREGHIPSLYALADAIIVHGEHLKRQLVTLCPEVEDKVHVNALGNYN